MPVILLLFALTASLAMAMDGGDNKTDNYLKTLAEENSARDFGLMTAEGFDGKWEVFASWPEEDSPYLRIPSGNLASFIPDAFLKKESSNMDIEMMDTKTPRLGEDRDSNNFKYGVNYKYEGGYWPESDSIWQKNRAADEKNNQLYLKRLDERYSSIISGNEVQFVHADSIHNDLLVKAHNEIFSDPGFENYREWIIKWASNSEDVYEDHSLKVRDFYDNLSSVPDLFGKNSKLMAKPAQDAASTDLTAENLNRLVWDYERSAAAVSSEDSHAGINNTYIAEYLHSADHKKSRHKNYAVIVGIDEYDDRTSLHTCVNDANSIADLMKTLGYEVILLSDNTERKPTKRNILDVALKDVSLKQNKGNIIFYFSGHGMHDSNNTFYLIPNDSNGDSTSYISEYELKQYIKDLDNLALIIDACDSEGLSESVGNGQLIIASSKKNEASNEEWTGSLSVFTSRLIEAIREEGRTSNKILLQKCFYRAYNDTVKWGQGILLHQTPVIMDLTGKKHYVL